MTNDWPKAAAKGKKPIDVSVKQDFQLVGLQTVRRESIAAPQLEHFNYLARCIRINDSAIGKFSACQRNRKIIPDAEFADLGCLLSDESDRGCLLIEIRKHMLDPSFAVRR